MTITITIAGTDQTAVCQSLSISDRLNSRKTAQVTAWDTANTFTASPGQEVSVQCGGVTIFAGLIQTAERRGVNINEIRWTLSLTDYAGYWDRHVIGTKEFNSYSLHDIVADIWVFAVANDQALSSEGITIGSVESPGPTLTRFLVKHESASAVLDRLCVATGRQWYVDYAKDTHVFLAGTNAAPWDITDASHPIEEPSYTQDLTRYRNRQFVRGPMSVVNTRAETFTGDGTTKSFYCQFPLAEEPTITLDGNSQTVGVFGVDTGCDWYWLEGATVIHQEFSADPIASGSALSVTYRDYGQNVAMAEDAAEIAARAAIEGRSGVYEDVLDISEVDDFAGLSELATAAVRRYGSVPGRFEYRIGSARASDVHLFRSGQTQNVQLTELGISTSTPFLIESVELSASAEDPNIHATISALDVSESLGDWTDYFGGHSDSSLNLSVSGPGGVAPENGPIAYAW